MEVIKEERESLLFVNTHIYIGIFLFLLIDLHWSIDNRSICIVDAMH